MASIALPFQVPVVQFPLYTTSHTNTFHHVAAMATPDVAADDPRKIAASISRSKEFPWYEESVGEKLTIGIRTLLEGYSGIPAKEVEDHVYKIVCTLLSDHQHIPSVTYARPFFYPKLYGQFQAKDRKMTYGLSNIHVAGHGLGDLSMAVYW